LKTKNLLVTTSLVTMFQLNQVGAAVSQSGGQSSDQATVMERTLSDLEKTIFHQQYGREIIISRLERLEIKIFGRIQSGSLQHRIDEIIVHSADRTSVKPESPTITQDRDEIPPPAPSRVKNDTPADNLLTGSSRFKPAASPPDPPPVSPEADKKNIEQASWDVSAVIDELLKAEENADSIALDNAMSKLFDMKPPRSDTSPAMVSKAEVCHQRGMSAFNQKKYRDALASLKEAQSENPWDATILNDLIRVLIKTNDLDSAVLYGPVAILVAPASTIAWCDMAEVFARAKQYSRARGCVYLACLMSDDSSKTLPAIQSEIASIEEPEVRAPFKQGLFIAEYTMKAYVDIKSGNIGQDKEIGPEADAALYKANMLLSFADGLQKIKPNSGIVIVVTVSKTGEVISSEVLRSSGDQDLDKMAVKALSEAKLLPLPKSIQSNSQQYIVLVDKVVQALAEPKHV